MTNRLAPTEWALLMCIVIACLIYGWTYCLAQKIAQHESRISQMEEYAPISAAK